MPVARFEILGILGSGAFGVVALARDRADAGADPVAVKVLKSGTEAELGRLREEAEMLAWIRHPNIVRVHRLLEKQGRPVVIMDWIRGASVAEQLRRLPLGLPADVALEIVRQCAGALRAAFETPGPDGVPTGIVHRDIKPGNILVSVGGDVTVVDFGIAADRHTRPGGKLLGTRGYFAPERGTGARDTPAVDVYALGVTLFEMLTGRPIGAPPAAARHDPSVADAVSGLSVPRVDRDGLRALVAAMCRYHPHERPGWSELIDRVGALIPDGVELRWHAEAHVRPLHEAREARMRDSHLALPDVAFLEDPGPVVDREVRTREPVRPLALRRETPMDVDRLLAEIGPELSSTDTAKLCDGLRALRGTRDPRVIALAEALTLDPDPEVVDLAWDLLISAA